ncbi:FGF [Parapoynx stagnalis nucleopolyhedrovirus]|uniref:FGF n=1 Tax=Parapoynx stagnalis nucleopolyhedrovirus TaxID=2993413 RepID=A0A9E8C0I1_9ABAC|nr:FGF [Parapoynx stagnalis nucleopolyhedrovirus]
MKLKTLVVIVIAIDNVFGHMEHFAGTQRPVHIFLNRRYLQVLPNGMVNGTSIRNSMYIVFRRESYKKSFVILRNAITCMYVCMDKCGFLYGTNFFSKDCYFKEHMEENNYNTYFRIYNRKRTFLALDNFGRSRRTQISLRRHISKMSTYVLTLLKRLPNKMYTVCPKSDILLKRQRKCKINV